MSAATATNGAIQAASSSSSSQQETSRASALQSTSKDMDLPPSAVIDNEINQARAIPKTFMTSLSAWWHSSEKSGEESELRMLRRLPFYRTELEPDVAPTSDNPSPLTARTFQVDLSEQSRSSGGERAINTLAFTTPATKGGKEAVVMTHGYGAGLAFFYRNFEEVAQTSASVNRPAYAIDWLGMGRSSRPHPKQLFSHKKTATKERVDKAESFFTDSLEEWRGKMGIEKMTLIGHSLGGYLSTAYALKYPNRVERLVLLSPAGVPNHPDKGEEVQEAEAVSAAQKELREPQSNYAPPPAEVEASNHAAIDETPSSSASSIKESNNNTSSSTFTPKKQAPSMMHKAFIWAWEEGWSPFGIVRKLGPVGPMLVGKYSARRFAQLPPEDITDLHDYIWTITNAKGSSEYAISHLLAPGAHARYPIVSRAHKLRIPVVFSYGDRDWMDIEGGIESVKVMKDAGNGRGRVIQVKDAGHHLYLDNPSVTNEMLKSEILEAAREAAQQRQK